MVEYLAIKALQVVTIYFVVVVLTGLKVECR